MGFCRSLGYISVRTVGNTYYDWRCIDRNGNDVSFSMQASCQWQYHTANVWDVTINFYSATGMGCFGTRMLGGINLNGFCQSEGYEGVILLGSTANDWHCYSRSFGGALLTAGALVGFDLYDACEWMYNQPDAVARFANFYSATSWQCIG
jgi:hypothetical protein